MAVPSRVSKQGEPIPDSIRTNCSSFYAVLIQNKARRSEYMKYHKFEQGELFEVTIDRDFERDAQRVYRNSKSI